MKLLVAYATAHGSTAEIARFMADTLTQQGNQVDFTPIDRVQSVAAYDACLLGTPIHNGLWLPPMTHFVYNRREDLTRIPLYFWVTCVRILEPDGYPHVLEHYLRADTLNRLGVRHCAAFAGKLALDDVTFTERWSLAVRYDGHRTADTFNGDYRNWQTIGAWLQEVIEDLKVVAADHHQPEDF